ncbi:unnamed protein product [Rhizopus microsporus]|uniref:Uncharacterized protein n=1 Tax=Rhizopus microsporus TaxID=58291 RepID=A0A1X0RYM3_RHIZD|nr:hypothetical protein BCV71DRAFT_6545 [Rhizopus microsporus]
MDKIGFQQSFETKDHEKVKAILNEYRDNTKDIIDSRVDLLLLAKSKPVPERNALLAIEALMPTLKDLDLPCLSSESHLTAVYIHPLIQHLFADNPSHK